MRVIPAMTGHAGPLEFLLLRHALVTGHATKVGMGAVQREFCLLRVIELHLVPGFGRMAGLALDPVPALVSVVTSMAIDARLAFGLLEVVPGMAGHAGEAPMASRQGKAGFLQMIERPLLPGDRGMARLAVRPALALVHVVDPVARDAGRGRVLVALPGVAETAFDFLVGAG